MPIFVCDICHSSKVKSDYAPQLCSNCGAMNGPWKMVMDGLDQFKLSTDNGSMVIFENKIIGRNDFKMFFPNQLDSEGDPIYKYCEVDKGMLEFFKGDDDCFYIKNTNETTNYFKINSKKVGEYKIKLRSGDTLELFSSNQSKVITSFKIE